MQRVLFLVLVVACVSCQRDEESAEFKPDPTAVYFLVGELSPVHGDSYLLALNDEEDIEAAREIISTGESKIILAEISRITDRRSQLNIDLNNGRRWSWYVSHFHEFADFTIEILDGWPGYVEDNYEEWVDVTKGDNGKGRIGFWNYTIKREVNPTELLND